MHSLKLKGQATRPDSKPAHPEQAQSRPRCYRLCQKRRTERGPGGCSKAYTHAEVRVGLRDWLAGNVAGASGYGSAMGRHAVKSGIELGRVFYLGHGTRARNITRKSHVRQHEGGWVIQCVNGLVGPFQTKEEAEQYEEDTFTNAPTVARLSDALVFENGEHMKSEGFDLYASDPAQAPPSEDSSQLSWHTRAAGIAFCVCCSIGAATNSMREANADSFNRSMGSSFREELARINMEVLCGSVNDYVALPKKMGVTKVIDTNKPGMNDCLAVFSAALSVQVPGSMVGFQRGGALGFGEAAVALAEETLVKVREASHKFRW